MQLRSPSNPKMLSGSLCGQLMALAVFFLFLAVIIEPAIRMAGRVMVWLSGGGQ